MSFEQKDGSGALFKNNEKESENHADYRGSIKIDGQEYWLDAWIRESKKGTKYMSLSAKLKKQMPAKAPEAAPFVDDSEIPF